jgi:hypothetical protein
MFAQRQRQHRSSSIAQMPERRLLGPYSLSKAKLESSTQKACWMCEHDNVPLLPNLQIVVESEGLHKDTANYLAISNVWFDGIGAGLRQAGYVNSCLFAFSENALSLSDVKESGGTTSIPEDKRARSVAIKQMNTSYRLAKCRLVQHNYLLNSPWTEDGTPCLAILLSPRFSRAWTATEFAALQEVWFLFKDSPVKGWTMKHLNDDILVQDRMTASLGHLLAFDFLETLWNKYGVESISRLVAVMKTRSS